MRTRLLTELDVFSEVANLQNFRQAASALGVTPPTLSRRIAALERELGVVLIRRTTRSFALTEAGEKLYLHAQLILRQTLKAREDLQANRDELVGHLRVGAPVDLITSLLTPMLAQYCAENAGISIAVTATQNQPDLDRDSLAVAFSVAHQSRPKDSSYAMHPVGSFPRMLYASKRYLEERGSPTSPEDLGNHSCIRHQEGTAEKHWELVRGRRRQTVAVQGVFACTSVSACAQAAREGIGIAMLPQHLATHPTYGGGLIHILTEWQGVPAYVFAVTAERVVPAKVKKLIQMVLKRFPKRLAEIEAVGPE